MTFSRERVIAVEGLPDSVQRQEQKLLTTLVVNNQWRTDDRHESLEIFYFFFCRFPTAYAMLTTLISIYLIMHTIQF